MKATLNRAEALEGADGVVITILSGGPNIFRHDIEIPQKYGVDICVGDTRGPSGIFRFLRTAPAMLEICRDAEKYCPDAVVLNYTNPMAVLCRYLQSETKARVTGHCHSVQGTAAMLAEWIGAPMDELTYSSGHNSEYNAWFRKRPDLIEKYCTHGTGWNPGAYAFVIKEYFDRETDGKWMKDIEEWLAKDDIDLARGGEYASNIFNAVFGDHTPYEFNANVRNFGLIDNLPEGCCVEVPAIAAKGGVRPFHVGKLPEQLAVLVNTSARCEELAVEGCIEGDKRKIFHAVLFDPLTPAVCSIDEIRQMVDEMFEAGKDYLGYFK